MDIMNVIQTLGFPIACVVACGWFIMKLWSEQTADKDKLYTELAKSREVNADAIKTIALYAAKLDSIQSDVTDIKNKISQN